jgi:hypothetical protein
MREVKKAKNWVVGQLESSSQFNTPYAKKQKIPSKMMQAHQGLHGIGNNHTNSQQAQFGRLRLPFFSDSIQFTLVRLESMRKQKAPRFQTDPLPKTGTGKVFRECLGLPALPVPKAPIELGILRDQIFWRFQ